MSSKSGGALALTIFLAALAVPAPAFDFGKLGDAVRKLDVNKALDVGKRIVASTTEMPEDQEIALGNDLTARLLGAMRPLDDAAVQAYVNRVGRWITLQTSRPDLPWRFAVADTDSLGAFATPGGNVVITAGLMRLMRDENELAGVLAHAPPRPREGSGCARRPPPGNEARAVWPPCRMQAASHGRARASNEYNFSPI